VGRDTGRAAVEAIDRVLAELPATDFEAKAEESLLRVREHVRGDQR
jgi:hypothetical protein